MITFKDAKNQIEKIKYFSAFGQTVICVILLKSGFVVNGSCSILDKEKYDFKTASRKAFQGAFNKIFELECYNIARNQKTETVTVTN